MFRPAVASRAAPLRATRPRLRSKQLPPGRYQSADASSVDPHWCLIVCRHSCSEIPSIPWYTCGMAKVMVSMPDDLLAEVDAEAGRLGSTRSAVLRSFADAALRKRRSDRAAAMRVLLRDV